MELPESASPVGSSARELSSTAEAEDAAETEEAAEAVVSDMVSGWRRDRLREVLGG